jgi:pimeloyl-ACP methyl ester carboxylesterase
MRQSPAVKTFSLLACAGFLVGGCASFPERGERAKSDAHSESHFASFGTNKIHYLTAGKGRQTIFFIHGWACNSLFWREQVPAFAGKARLIFIDLPGHGQSDKPHTRYTTDFFADAVLAVMRDAHVNKAVLVGHSMGTSVMCRVYARAPGKVAALVVVDGFLRRNRRVPEDAEKFIAPYRAASYRDRMARFVRNVFPNAGSEELQEFVLSEMLKTPQHVIISAMEEPMVAVDQPDWDLKRVNVPLLVVHAKDPFWTADYETYVHSVSPQTDYHIMEGVGHFLMLEKPAQFNDILTEMLRKFGSIEK